MCIVNPSIINAQVLSLKFIPTIKGKATSADEYFELNQ
jgi:hypothetical protein